MVGGLKGRLSPWVKARAFTWFYAALLFGPTYALLSFWFTRGSINLGTGYLLYVLVPMIEAVALAGFVGNKNRLGFDPRFLASLAVFALLPYTIYDWARVPMNYFFGVAFWDHWFDWGSNISGAPLFALQSLSVGLFTHVSRGWSMAVSYYVLVRGRATLPTAFVFAWAMTIFYWIFFPTFVLVDSKPPFIWWFTAWSSHMAFALGLWYAPRLFSRYFSMR